MTATAAWDCPLLGFRTWDDPHECPPSTYSPWHYITPAVFRARAFCHPLNRYTYAEDRHPNIPLQFNPIPYKCIAVPPLEGCSSWPPGSCAPRPVQAPENKQAPGADARPDSARPEPLPPPKPGT